MVTARSNCLSDTDSSPCLPDSLPMARKRLYLLKRKLERGPEFHKQYSSVLNNYQAEGSSRRVPDEEIPTLKLIWYLPHHAVWHPRKPSERTVVFDCTSKSAGVSLNDQLLQGPENTSLLLGVILRFRVNVQHSSCSRCEKDFPSSFRFA